MLNILKLFLINLIEMKWNEEKRQAWLEKNSNKIDKAFNAAMVVIMLVNSMMRLNKKRN